MRYNDSEYKTCETEVNSDLGIKPGQNKGIRAKYVAHKYQDLNHSIPSIINDLLDAIEKLAKKS